MQPQLKPPAVSVVLPVFNGAAFIRRAIDSVFRQTTDDWELLIVDDASTDGTAAIIATYTDPRVRVITHDVTRGVSRSANAALAEARGEYIARHDADDVSSRARLATQVAFLRENPDITLVGSWFVAIDAAGAMLRHTRLPTAHVDLCWALHFFSPFLHSSVMWRRAATAADGRPYRYDDRRTFGEDQELWMRMAERHRIANLPEYLVQYREHATSATATAAHGDYGRAAEHLHRRAVAALLAPAWRDVPAGEQARRWAAMRAVLRSSPSPPLPLRRLRTAITDLLTLQRAFGRRLPPGERRLHRAGVRTAIAFGVLRMRAAAIGAGRWQEADCLLVVAACARWQLAAQRAALHALTRTSRWLTWCWGVNVATRPRRQWR